MPFPIKTFRLSFIWHARQCWEIVQAFAACEAIRICQQRYPGSTSYSWWEETT